MRAPLIQPLIRGPRALAGAVLAALLAVAALPAAAHKLNVFAFVEAAAVIVEAKFSTGKVPVAGEVRVFDAEGALISTLALEEDGTATFPLDPALAETGVKVEVEVSDGHADYWILTPADIAKGMEGS